MTNATQQIAEHSSRSAWLLIPIKELLKKLPKLPLVGFFRNQQASSIPQIEIPRVPAQAAPTATATATATTTLAVVTARPPTNSTQTESTNLQIAPEQDPTGVDKAQEKLKDKLLKLDSKMLKIYKRYYQEPKDNRLPNNWIYWVNITEMVAKTLTMTAQSETEKLAIREVYSFLHNHFSLQKENNQVKLFWSLNVYKTYLINMSTLDNSISETGPINHINKIKFLANCAFSLITTHEQIRAKETLDMLIEIIFPKTEIIYDDFPELKLAHNSKSNAKDLAENKSFMQIFSISSNQQIPRQKSVLNYLKLKIWAMIYELEILKIAPENNEQKEFKATLRTQKNDISLKNLLLRNYTLLQLEQASAINFKTGHKVVFRFFEDINKILSLYEQLELDIELVKDNIKMMPNINQWYYKQISDSFLEEYNNITVGTPTEKVGEQAKQMCQAFSIFENWYSEQEHKNRPEQISQKKIDCIKNLAAIYHAINKLKIENEEDIAHRTFKIRVIPDTNIPEKNVSKEFNTNLATLLAITALNEDFYTTLNPQSNLQSTKRTRSPSNDFFPSGFFPSGFFPSEFVPSDFVLPNKRARQEVRQ